MPQRISAASETFREARAKKAPTKRKGESWKDFDARMQSWLRGEDVPHVQPDLAPYKTADLHLNREKD